MGNTVNTKMISDFITANNLTQKEFCRQCKISYYSFRKIMLNQNFNLQALFRIAKRMDRHVCEFFK